MVNLLHEEIQVISGHPIDEALKTFRRSFVLACKKLAVANYSESIERVVLSQGIIMPKL